jgi:2-hydroxy-3-keto-5-methylthiopentenyl-1-phosphate phosphatase
MLFRVLCDFDGTVTTVDTADTIFERFAAPEWREIEGLWEAGEIGSAECMRRQMELIDASLAELDEALDGLEIDPTFPAFHAFCQARGIELVVVSDGVDYFIRRILQRSGLSKLSICANRFIQRGQRRFSLGHPHRVQDCASGAGTCKCARAAEGSASCRTILIGDGRSDFCVAHEADIVFAKKSLLRYVRERNIPAFEYTSFADVEAALNAILPVGRRDTIVTAGLGASA